MPGWGFRPESGQSAAGANTIAARAKGFQPYYALILFQNVQLL